MASEAKGAACIAFAKEGRNGRIMHFMAARALDLAVVKRGVAPASLGVRRRAKTAAQARWVGHRDGVVIAEVQAELHPGRRSSVIFGMAALAVRSPPPGGRRTSVEAIPIDDFVLVGERVRHPTSEPTMFLTI